MNHVWIIMYYNYHHYTFRCVSLGLWLRSWGFRGAGVFLTTSKMRNSPSNNCFWWNEFEFKHCAHVYSLHIIYSLLLYSFVESISTCYFRGNWSLCPVSPCTWKYSFDNNLWYILNLNDRIVLYFVYDICFWQTAVDDSNALYQLFSRSNHERLMNS